MNNWFMLLAFAISLILGIIAGPIIIPKLVKLKFGQTIREEGPKTHLKKQGTPTIGGLIFLIPTAIVSAIVFVICTILNVKTQILPLLIATVMFGLVGFLDDILKIKKHSKDGLKAYQKFGLLVIVALAFSLYLMFIGPKNSTVVYFDFFSLHAAVDFKWFFVPYAVLVFASTTNAVNLTDGLDGLCAGTSAISFSMFAAITLIMQFTGAFDISVAWFSVILCGALLAFLLFNFNPAKVFMGDMGSLALGGAMAAVTILLGRPVVLVIGGLVYVCEALSVILQVSYFKLTHGKRIFKMTPIHHHFELCGMAEKKVVFMFYGATFIFSLIAIFSVVL